MKQVFTSIVFLLGLATYSMAQLTITEFSYNPPESGTDSLEYIELYNGGASAINLKDYKITKGVEFTFPEVTIESKAYLLLSVKASAIQNNYGKTSLQWTAGALNNAGEVVTITDASGVDVISVDLKDVPPWPGLAEGTDGDGKSIELCDVTADPNDGANWKVSTKDLGFQINGKQIFGTPGYANSLTSCTGVPTNVYPLRSISSVTSTDASGVVDSVSVSCSIKGIVYGVNLNAVGLQFTLIDNANNGIGAYNGTGNLNYTVKEGDEVELKGTISQFNGFTQMVVVEANLISQNNALVSPKPITSFAEIDESSFVTLSGVHFSDPTQWTGAGSGFNVSMLDNAGHSFDVRIDNDIDAYAMAIPSSASSWNVSGLLGQYDNSSPYTDGYQLLPRYFVDFSPVGATHNLLDENMKAIPNPTSGIIQLVTNEMPEFIIVYDALGKELMSVAKTNQVDLAAFNKGMYTLKVVKGNKSNSFRIIKCQ